MRFLFIFLIYFGLMSCVYAQSYEDSVSHKLSLHFTGDSFLKNNEFFSPHTEGFTGIGFIIQPRLNYQIDERSSVELGYHFLKYSGLNSFSEAIPLFTIRSTVKPGWTVLLGSIEGGAKHKLSEPFYRIDNDYQNQIEYGIQSLLDYDWISSDLWLHWEQFIKKDDPFPEEVYGGNTSKIRITQTKTFSIHLNSELLISHLGGQIDADDNPDRTILNYAVGPSLTHQHNQNLKLTLKYLFYKSSVTKQVADSQSQFYIPFATGHAHYPQLKILANTFSVTTGYWSSNSFVSPRGEFLFSSLSDNNAKYSEAIRKIWTNVLTYDINPFPYLRLSVFGSTYFDAIEKHLDYHYGLRALLKLYFKKE